MARQKRQIRVLIVDSSLRVRKLLAAGLAEDPGIQVVGTAPDPYIARDRIIEWAPDVLTLDIDLPRMNGVEFLRRLMPQYPLPVIMVSTQTVKGKQVTLEALEAGAVDFIAKPSQNLSQGQALDQMIMELRTKIKIASMANVAHWKEPCQPKAKVGGGVGCMPRYAEALSASEAAERIIAIGASTGGTDALAQLAPLFPAHTPGIMVVQHMPAGFTRIFAERLNAISTLEVKEAESGDRVFPGRMLIAPGERHMRLRRGHHGFEVDCRNGAKVSGHCPSVDVLMHSVAQHAGRHAIGVMLTGMGRDGAEGMRAMRDAGSRNLAQDERSSVVFGMPKEAYANGGAERLVSLEQIVDTILAWLH